MIEKIKFKFDSENNTNKVFLRGIHPYWYAKDVFKNLKGHEIKFSPGINVLVGENGSGKTTIIDIIRTLTLCRGKFYSEQDFTHLDNAKWSRILNTSKGIDLYAGYDIVTFNMYNLNQMDAISESCEDYDFRSSRIQQKMAYAEESAGQRVVGDITSMLNYAFGDHRLDNLGTGCFNENKFNNKNYKKYQTYCKNHMCEERIITMLFDEPDKGLSIENLEFIKDIYTYPRSDTQTIVVLHNPILILSVINNPNVNIIELTPGYVDKLVKFAKENLKDLNLTD